MQKLLFPLLMVFLATSTLLGQAGDDRLKEVSNMAAEDKMGWTLGTGVGLDLAGMGIINPLVGGGTSRFGLGGLGTFMAKNKSEKSFWNNQVSLQLSVQKLGRSALNQPDGFQKNLDVLRLTSTYGHKIIGEKWYISADLLAQSQLLKTYASNYLSPLDSADHVVSNFLSPLLIQLSPGITFKPNDHFSVQYSPFALRFIYVADDTIASLNIQGNDNGKNTFTGLGSELVGRYTNKFYGDRIAYNGTLRLFSNYLQGPQNIDVLFANNLSVQLFKGFSLDLLGEVFYDQDVKMNIDTNDNGVYGDAGDKQAPATQLTGAFLLKYNKIF
ncbi:MAG: DUF3078 domain-containing protein [Lewinellaceae bacterium]|nr:DUF3078 domain-containing protein [Lewinellaceae bacterium]